MEPLSRETVAKLAIDEDGMYRITYFDLLDAGIQPESINPNFLQLTNRGKEVPLYFSNPGNQWKKSAYLEFYGTFNHGSTSYSDEYSDSNIYLLHWQDKRVSSSRYKIQNTDSTSTNLSTAVPYIYKSKIHREEKTTYSRSEESDSNTKDHWYWYELVAPDEKTIIFLLPGLLTDRQRDCILRIKFVGVSHLPENPDHYVTMKLNDRYIGQARWDGTGEYIYTNYKVPISYLYPGRNKLTIILPGKDGDPKHIVPEIDVVFLCWFEVEYWRSTLVDNDYLQFQVTNDQSTAIAIVGFTQSDIALYNSTESVKIDPDILSQRDNQGQTTYTACFSRSDNTKTEQYIAYTQDRYKSPVSIEKKQLSYWKNPALGADYIIITHPAFYDTLLRLTQWRASQGLRVQLINVEDIYDEFNYGIKHPQAIKDFLHYAYNNWKPPHLKYVLLVGDASWDIKNNLNLAAGNTFMPVYFYASPAGFAACDNWYACFDTTDNIPKFAIGRIPTHSISEAQAIVNKILQYEQSPEYGSWHQSVLFLATPRDWTARVNDILLNKYLPKQLNPLPWYSTPTSRFNINSNAVIQWISQGHLLVHYAGHASVFNWDIGRPGNEGLPEAVGYKDQGFFGVRHVPRLQNRNRYPIVISMTCYSNQFDSLWSDGIGESLVKADHAGAIATIGGTYRVTEICFEEFDSVFIPKLLSSGFKRIGDSFIQAKQELNNPEVNDLYILLGDPALLISIPIPIDDMKSERKYQDQHEVISVYGTTTTYQYHHGIIQLLNSTGEMIDKQQIDLTSHTWQGSFSISSIYRSVPLIITVYLWDEKNRWEAAGRTVLSSNLIGNLQPK
ncbi:MAG: C25 family cysteine peptidase [bacterium]